MDHQLSNQTIMETIDALELNLTRLCQKYLDGCNSGYSIDFYKISPPDPLDLDKRFDDLQDGLRQFLTGVFGGPMGGFVILDKSKADLINSIGAIPSTQENLMNVFMTPMLEALQPLQPSFYTLSDEGEQKYDKLLKPVIMSISVAAICIQDMWFIMMATWSD
jgi:hypothetical protein